MVIRLSDTPEADPNPTGGWDYVSPDLVPVQADAFFPHMIAGDPRHNGWLYLRGEVPHIWYVDDRFPTMGFMNRDEVTLLHNIALQFKGKRALEIGCWMGWSSCHLALANVVLDVVDPVLADPVFQQSVTASLKAAGVADNVSLHARFSPDGVTELASEGHAPWSLIVVDGDHERPGPARDVMACLQHCADDCAFVFHDLASPHVAEGLRLLEARGFLVLLYQTQQIMGLAWRGNVTPPNHVPDPDVFWQLPHHLAGLPVSGVSLPGHGADLYNRLFAMEAQIVARESQITRQDTMIQNLEHQVTELQHSSTFRFRRRFASWMRGK